MYCKNCGKEIDDNAYICPNCGVKVKDDLVELRERQAAANLEADSGSKAGWGILSFFIPIVGLILFLLWKTDRPKTASICGKCALAAAILYAVVVIIYVIIVVAAIGSIGALV